MRLLESHDQLEQLLGRQPTPEGESLPPFTIIWFSASWCGPCRRVNPDRLVTEVPFVNWLKCDVDMNSHSAGYCQVRSIPYFMIIADKQVRASFQSSETNDIIDWATSAYNAWKERATKMGA